MYGVPGTSSRSDTSFASASVESTDALAVEKNRLLETCQKKAHLDGKFFTIDLSESSIDGLIVGTCMLCQPQTRIKGTLRSSTKYLQHLKTKHPREFEDDYPRYKRIKLDELAECPTSEVNEGSHCDFSQSAFEKSVANYILVSGLSSSTVELQSFRKIFDSMDIKSNGVPLKHMSRRTVERRIRQICRENMDIIRSHLKNVAAYVCTTADVWTARDRRFLGVTVHWVDPEQFVRHSAAIAYRRFEGSPSHDQITQLLEKIHTEFGLDSKKIVATMTENFQKAFRKIGPNVTKNDPIVDEIDAASEEEEEFDSESDEESCSLETDENESASHDEIGEDVSSSELPRYLKCPSQTLSLLVTVDVRQTVESSPRLSSQFDQVMTRCKSLWNVVRSPKRRKTLKNMLGQSISRPSRASWISLLSSLRQIENLQEKLIESTEALDITPPLRATDFKLISEYLKCLTPVETTFDRLQGEKEGCYGYLLPNLISLRCNLKQIKNNGQLEYCQIIVADLIQNLEFRFDDFFKVEGNSVFAAVAAILQPSLKTRWLRCLSQDAQAKVRDAVMKAAKEASKSSSRCQPNEEDDLMCVDDDGYDFGDDHGIIDDDHLSLQESATESQMRIFMSHPCSEDLSVINRYPKLRDLFLRYNTPLTSSAPVEKLFSRPTTMKLLRVNRSTDHNFERRILAKCNYDILQTLSDMKKD